MQGALQVLAALQSLHQEQRAAANAVLAVGALAGLPELQGFPAVLQRAQQTLQDSVDDSRQAPCSSGAAISLRASSLSWMHHLCICM